MPLTPQQIASLNAENAKRDARRKSAAELDGRIRERAYALVQDAVNAKPGEDGKRPPVPGFSAALETARQQLAAEDSQAANTSATAAGAKVVDMPKQPKSKPAEAPAADPAPAV